jgi:hypothetical protein
VGFWLVACAVSKPKGGTSQGCFDLNNLNYKESTTLEEEIGGQMGV